MEITYIGHATLLIEMAGVRILTDPNFEDALGYFLKRVSAPGIPLAKLPRIELAVPTRAIGTNTLAAMQSGALIGYVGLVRELLGAIRAELAERGDGAPLPTVIATGGLSAADWATGLPGVDVIDPLLTLRGLANLHDETRARAAAAAPPADR